jgi:hypothetical protein
MKHKLLTTGFAACLASVLFATGCQKKTGELSMELQARFEKEAIAHRADDLIFRRTHLAGEQDGSSDEKQASILVTSSSVFLHVWSRSHRARQGSTRSTATRIGSVCAPAVASPP